MAPWGAHESPGPCLGGGCSALAPESKSPTDEAPGLVPRDGKVDTFLMPPKHGGLTETGHHAEKR